MLLDKNYKTIQVNREKNKMYWNNIAYQFLQQKYNINTSCQGILIEPTKKIITIYVVGNLTLIDL